MFIKKSNYKALLSEIEGLRSQLVIVEAHEKSIEENYALAVKQNIKLLGEVSLLKSNQIPKNVNITTPKKDNSVESKIKAIKSHLETKGNITSWEAIELYNYTRLSDAIYRLKRKGMDISTTPEEYNNATFVRYHLNKAVK